MLASRGHAPHTSGPTGGGQAEKAYNSAVSAILDKYFELAAGKKGIESTDKDEVSTHAARSSSRTDAGGQAREYM